MLPGEAPGRGAPGRGAPGRGTGRGIGRSTGCADEKGLLPTRGVRTPGLGAGPGRGPGVMPGCGPGWPVGWPGAGGFGCPGCPGCPGVGRPGTGPGRAGASVGAAGAACAVAAVAAAAASPLPMALSRAWSSDLSGPLTGALAAGLAAVFWGAALPPPKDSRSRRATGASTVDDADFTNSPCSFSRARTSLLVTPSSLANSCTRALPATTSPVYEATVVGPRLGFSYDAWSSGLHGVLMFFAASSVAAETIGRA